MKSIASSIGVFGDLKPNQSTTLIIALFHEKIYLKKKTERKKTHEGASSASWPSHSASRLFSFRIAESTAFLYESAANPVGKISPLEKTETIKTE